MKKKILMLFIATATTIICILGLTACGNSNYPQTIAVSSVELNKSSATIEVGDTLSLSATISPSNATNKNVTWSSSNTSVATVSNGTVTAKSAGTTIITVKTNNDKVATCEVRINERSPFIFAEYGLGYALTGYTGTDTTVTVPASYNGKPVVAIGKGTSGNYGFYNNTAIKKVILPSSVYTIMTYAFKNCYFLETIEMPNVITIESEAFSKCSALKEVTIPKSCVSIEYRAFEGCGNLKKVTVEHINTLLDSSNLLSIVDELVIGGEGAIRGFSSQIKKLTLLNGITEISEGAGKNHTSLQEVVLSNSVTSIGKDAFSGCSNLTSITIPNSVTSIGERAFENCDSLTSITIPNSVTSIGYIAFADCSSLTSITIGNNVTSIGYWAFLNCSSLTKVNYTGTIDQWAQIEFDGSVANPVSYAKNLYINDTLVTNANITTATKINDCAFYGCSSLESITIGNSVTSIGSGAFYGCSSLEEITIPFVGDRIKSSTDTYQYPFGYIFGTNSYTGGTAITQYYYGSSTTSTTSTTYYIPTSLNKVTITGGNILYGAFYGCDSLTSITIGNSVTSIGSSAFYGCSSLTSITIPSSVNSIGSSAFYGCSSLEEMTIPFVGGSVKSSTDTYQYPFGYIFGTSSYTGGTATQQYYHGSSTSSTTSTTYYIPTSLKKVTVTGGNILGYAFYGCSSLKNITIGNSVTSIGEDAFAYCRNLMSITIPNSVTSIGRGAFDDCSSLTKVNYTGTIDQWAQIEFDMANPVSYAKNLYINDTLVTNANITTATKLNAYAFRNCDSLTSITIGNSVTSIGSWAFAECDSLTSITIGNSVKSIGSSAFSGCSSLKNITIGNSVKSIGSSAFSGCSSLKNITIPNSVTSIGEDAFYYCNSLTSMTLPFVGASRYAGTSNEHFGYVFGAINNGYNGGYVPSSLKTVVITDAYRIGVGAFAYCRSLTNITIPNSVTSIGSSAFYECSGLKGIVFEDTTTWYRTDSSSNMVNKTGGTQTSVTNSSTNVTYFTSTYYDYYWYKL